MQEEVLPEEGDLVDLALGDPPEIERQVVERRDVDHRVVVHGNDVTLAAVDPLKTLDALAPEGRDGEEDPHEDAREFVHDAAAPVEGIADDQRNGRQDHEKGAQQHQEDVVQGTQHRRRGVLDGLDPGAAET